MTKKELKMRKSDSDDVEDADELELRYSHDNILSMSALLNFKYKFLRVY